MLHSIQNRATRYLNLTIYTPLILIIRLMRHTIRYIAQIFQHIPQIDRKLAEKAGWSSKRHMRRI